MSQNAPYTLTRALHRSVRLNASIVEAQLADLVHAESLLQPAEGGNCLNWLLGHLVNNRLDALKLIELPAPFDAAPYARYARHSDPVLTDGEDVLPLDTLHANLVATQAPLLEWLAAAAPEALDALPPGQTRTVAEQLSFALWHESLHVGQLEQYRRLSGRTEKVI